MRKGNFIIRKNYIKTNEKKKYFLIRSLSTKERTSHISYRLFP